MFVGGIYMKIVNLKKFIRSICLILIVAFVLSLICAKSTLSHKEIEYKLIYVAKGDTLWEIASDLQKSNDYYKTKDIRYIISDIKNINNLESSNLHIDQELMVPVI